MKAVRVTTILLITSLVIAFIFAVVGFSSAANSQVSSFGVLLYFVLSSVFFGITAIIGLYQSGRWERFAGVAAVVAALYMIIMAVVFMRMFNTLDIPIEYVEPGDRPDTYEPPPTMDVPGLGQ